MAYAPIKIAYTLGAPRQLVYSFLASTLGLNGRASQRRRGRKPRHARVFAFVRKVVTVVKGLLVLIRPQSGLRLRTRRQKGSLPTSSTTRTSSRLALGVGERIGNGGVV
jgi:hypothetical protein